MIAKIHQFNPILYPVKLWVYFGGNINPIGEQFVHETGSPFVVKFEKHFIAFAENVVQKETAYWGVIVVFKSKRYVIYKLYPMKQPM